MDSIRNDTERYPTSKIFLDCKDCIIANSDPIHPVITCTSDHFEEYEKLYDFIKKENAENLMPKVST